jgi:hypothetical protein
MTRRWFVITLLACVLLLPATPALADDGPPDGDGLVIWNKDYTMEEGETLEGDLLVFNGDVTMEPGSRVEGSVVVWNGSADVEGTIEEDLVVSSGDIYLSDDAYVEGSVVCSWNCDLEQEEGARVNGEIIEGTPVPGLPFENWDRFPWVPYPPVMPELTFWTSGPGLMMNWALQLMQGAVAVLVVAAIAGLVGLMLPQHTAQVSRTVAQAPWHSFGIGVLTLVAATVLIVVLTITICLAPIAIIAGLALGVAGVFGWICVGALVGERLLQALNARETAPIWTAGLGTLAVTGVAALLGMVPCIGVIGALMVFILGCLGLGAVVLTRFGTTAYNIPSRSTPPAPAPPEGEPGDDD